MNAAPEESCILCLKPQTSLFSITSESIHKAEASYLAHYAYDRSW